MTSPAPLSCLLHRATSIPHIETFVYVSEDAFPKAISPSFPTAQSQSSISGGRQTQARNGLLGHRCLHLYVGHHRFRDPCSSDARTLKGHTICHTDGGSANCRHLKWQAAIENGNLHPHTFVGCQTACHLSARDQAQSSHWHRNVGRFLPSKCRILEPNGLSRIVGPAAGLGTVNCCG